MKRVEKMTLRAGLAPMFAFAVAVAAYADAPVVYTNWKGGAAASPSFYSPYSDGEGNPVTFNNDGTEYLVVTNANWSQGLQFNWNLYGLCFDMTSRSYTDNTGRITLGAGGFRCAKACRYAVAGSLDAYTMRLYLSASQTWEGPDSGSYAAFSIGDDGHNNGYPNYRKCILGADPGVTDWTIRKRLNLWILYTNRISHVDVRLESPARIYLPTAWSSGSPAVTINYLPKIGAKSLTLAGDGVMWRAGVKTTDQQPMTTAAPVGVLNPNLDSETLAPKLILEGGADLVVTNAVWDIPELIVTGEGATSTFIGTMTFQRESTSIELRDGARLEMPDVSAERDVSASLAVSGTGMVRIATAGWGLTGTLALGEDVDLELAGMDTFSGTVTGGHALSLDPGAGNFRQIPAGVYAGMADKKLSLLSGTLYVSSMSDLPSTATIDIAADAAVVFTSDAGFDASRITGAGAANVTFDSMVVTDTPTAADELTVCTGEVLRVIGSGLTAATSLTLAGGTLRFERSTTVSSPVLVTAGSFIEAAGSGIVGTMSGAITGGCLYTTPRSTTFPVRFGYDETITRNVTGIWVLGPGKVVFSGGGDFRSTRDELVVTREASVDLVGGTYAFGGRGDAPGTSLMRIQSLKDNVAYGYGRKICVKDGGSVTFAAPSGSSVNACILVASSKDGGLYNTTTKIATFEVGTGGSVTLPRKGRIYLGSLDSHVELKLSGGSLSLDAEDSIIYVGNGERTPGADIILESGTLSLGAPIYRNGGCETPTGNRSSRGRFLWSGGTLKLNSHFSAATLFDLVDSLKDNSSERVNGYLRVITRISGDGCTLDLSEMNGASVANVPAGLDQAEWYGTGTITVKGGKEFVMNSFPDSISFRTEGEGTRITVPPTAYVYDNETCLTYFNRSMNDLGNPYSTTNSALAAATVATYTSAGTNCTFAATRENLPLSVTNVLVMGEWNNAHSVSAVGGFTLGDIEFAEGALLSVAWRNGATASQAFDGTLTLPEHLSARLIRDDGIVPTGQAAISASQGIVGSAAWTERHCRVIVDSTTVRVVPIGTMVSIR